MNTRVITQEDHGEMNSRLLARQAMADFRRVESASRKIPVTLYSPEGKRLFIRYFNTMQLNTHFISVIARLSLPSEEIDVVEGKIEQQLAQHIDKVNLALVEAEEMCRKNGIESLATYDIEPLTIEAKVISRLGRRYLELIGKVDQLMPMIETLAIDEIIGSSEMNARKAKVKRLVRDISGSARTLRAALHKRINAAVAEKGLASSLLNETRPAMANQNGVGAGPGDAAGDAAGIGIAGRREGIVLGRHEAASVVGPPT